MFHYKFKFKFKFLFIIFIILISKNVIAFTDEVDELSELNELKKVELAEEQPLSFEITKRKLKEELMIVQMVSKNRRSFILSSGVKDGTLKGQERIFSNDNISLLCRAIEVNREYSLWAPIDPYANIPFNKDDFVSSNSHAYGSVALDLVGSMNDLTLTKEREESIEIEAYQNFITKNNFSLKSSFEQGLTQSSSGVSSDQNAARQGYSLSVEYNLRFIPQFEMSLGGRFDQEVYRQTDPQLDIPTTRSLATGALTYHFEPFSNNHNNLYLSLAAGIGKSTTEVDGFKSQGYVTILPEARIGYLMVFKKSLAMILEASIESISANEKFDSGENQITNMISTKATIGIRF